MIKVCGYPLKPHICRCGGIGRHKGLKIPRSNIRIGSSPISGTTLEAIQSTWVLHKYNLGVSCYIFYLL